MDEHARRAPRMHAHGRGGPRVVVGVDGSGPSRTALRWGALLARQWNGCLDVVMAWKPVPLHEWAPAGADPGTSRNSRREAERSLQAQLDEVFGAGRPPGLRARILEGEAAHLLAEHADGAAVLVVGSHGRGAIGRLLLGSVSTSCAAHAPCAVLVVHEEDEPPAGRRRGVSAVRGGSGCGS